jgi:hypothetical protein
MPKHRKSGRVPGLRLGRARGPFDFFGPSPGRDFAIEQGMDEETFGALTFISMADDSRNPPCPGPIVIHGDGSIECEAGCEGIRHAYHGPGSTVSCTVHGPSTSHSCEACADVPSAATQSA